MTRRKTLWAELLFDPPPHSISNLDFARRSKSFIGLECYHVTQYVSGRVHVVALDFHLKFFLPNLSDEFKGLDTNEDDLLMTAFRLAKMLMV